MTTVFFQSVEELNSLSEVIKRITSLPANNAPEAVDLRFYYRGHSNKNYALCPSIARQARGIGIETSLIETAKNKLPQVFDSDDILILLAKMQHYGLPTRLIDFTSNPLVALFFACQNIETDGEVLVFPEYIYQKGKARYGHVRLLYDFDQKETEEECLDEIIISNSFFSHSFTKELFIRLIDTIPSKGMLVSEYIKMHENQSWFSNWARKAHFYELTETQKEIAIVSILHSPIFVETQESILRQKLQQGKYLLIPNKVESISENYVIKQELPELFCNVNNYGRWIIKAENKAKMLEDLNKIGINEEVLYGDSIDHICSYIKRTICE